MIEAFLRPGETVFEVEEGVGRPTPWRILESNELVSPVVAVLVANYWYDCLFTD